MSNDYGSKIDLREFSYNSWVKSATIEKRLKKQSKNEIIHQTMKFPEV